MIVVGITGSIATGKTFVAEYFKQKKCRVFSADQNVHALLEQNRRIIEMVSRFFPGTVQTGKVNRAMLADIVFKNPEKLTLLENILHPYVEQEILWFIEKMKRSEGAFGILEIPLLFEKEWEKYCHYVIVTHCDSHLQKKRALARNGMTEEKFEAILRKQMPEDKKKEKASFLIDTSGEATHSIEQIERIALVLQEKLQQSVSKGTS